MTETTRRNAGTAAPRSTYRQVPGDGLPLEIRRTAAPAAAQGITRDDVLAGVAFVGFVLLLIFVPELVRA